MRYQPHIDGLRCIAVLAVAFFHFEFGFAPGGFIGVDVFFVISGYLITKLIYQQTQNGTFTFWNFYVRRARRLMPALFATLLLTFVTASALFSAEQFTRLSTVIPAALFSVSNVFFWLEAGYFDNDAITKPLLHTWSLSVEEQFYLVWPALLVFVIPKLSATARTLFFAALIGVSTIGAELLQTHDQTAAFFLTPFRMAEFAFGAILVWSNKLVPQRRFAIELLFVAGIALIVYPVVSYQQDMRFPGLSALVPCLGAALLIWIGDKSIASSLLTNRIAVAIGLVSYSLYLLHWPVLVLATTAWGDLTVEYKWLLLAASIALSALFYFLIEQPFRRKWQSPWIYPALANAPALCAAIIALTAITSHVVWTNGWLWRYEPSIQNLMAFNEDFRKTNRLGTCYLPTKGDYQAIPKTCYDLSTAKHPGKPSILIIGSSHSADLWPGFAKVFDDINVFQLSMAGCHIRRQTKPHWKPQCREFIRFVFDDVLPANNYDLVILSSGTKPGPNWQKTLQVLQTSSKDFVIFGMRPTIKNGPQAIISRHGRLEGLNEVFTKLMRNNPDRDRYWVALDRANYFSVYNAICPPDTQCAGISNGAPTYRDKTHFTAEGSTLVAKAFRKWLQQEREWDFNKISGR